MLFDNPLYILLHRKIYLGKQTLPISSRGQLKEINKIVLELFGVGLCRLKAKFQVFGMQSDGSGGENRNISGRKFSGDQERWDFLVLFLLKIARTLRHLRHC